QRGERAQNLIACLARGDAETNAIEHFVLVAAGGHGQTRDQVVEPIDQLGKIPSSQLDGRVLDWESTLGEQGSLGFGGELRSSESENEPVRAVVERAGETARYDVSKIS